MIGMDVFSGDGFSVFDLTTALDRLPYVPGFLGGLGIFEPEPIMTEQVGIERRGNNLALVPITPRGAPLPRADRDRRDIRYFPTYRVAKGDQLRASELRNIRAFGQTTELQQLDEIVLARLNKIRRDVILSHEYMRLGAIQGLFLNPGNGNTVINWFDEFGISAPTEIAFDLSNSSPAEGAIRRLANDVVRTMARNAEGGWIEGQTRVGALASDTFFDDLTSHPEVIKTYLNWTAAADLRNSHGQAWSSFVYGGIEWFNYRGTDDNSTVAVPDGKARFFPINGNGVFKHVMSPGETFDDLGAMGQEFYAMTIPDRDRNQFVELEVYSYPLFAVTRPQMLLTARRGA